jgi:transcriptional regulator with XRE-family HTH domain
LGFYTGLVKKRTRKRNVEKNTFTPEHQALCELLRQVRREAGVTQVELAVRLKRDQTFISKYESGERMLDVIEVRKICVALEIPLEKFVRRWERLLAMSSTE